MLGATEAVATILNDDVEAALQLTLVSWAENGVRLSFPATPGRTYAVERSLTLAQGTWIQVGLAILATTQTLEIQDSDPAMHQTAYYRVVRLD